MPKAGSADGTKPVQRTAAKVTEKQKNGAAAAASGSKPVQPSGIVPADKASIMS